jgi:hypothetical protein
MALMQLTFLTASADAEKKNDEPEITTTTQNSAAVTNVPTQKASALQEPEIKFAQKPTVSFESLKLKSSFSLNEAKTLQPGKSDLAVNEEQVSYSNKEVVFEDVKSAIFTYAQQKQQQGARQLHATLTNSAISFGQNQVTLTINNETQRELLQNMKQEFLDELRKLLQNNSITLQLEISRQENAVKAYKPADIFKAMTEKNPALLELKKRFDLEIDY